MLGVKVSQSSVWFNKQGFKTERRVPIKRSQTELPSGKGDVLDLLNSLFSLELD